MQSSSSGQAADHTCATDWHVSLLVSEHVSDWLASSTEMAFSTFEKTLQSLLSGILYAVPSILSMHASQPQLPYASPELHLLTLHCVPAT